MGFCLLAIHKYVRTRIRKVWRYIGQDHHEDRPLSPPNSNSLVLINEGNVFRSKVPMAPFQPKASAQREPGRELCRGSGVPHRLAQSLPLRPKGIWNRTWWSPALPVGQRGPHSPASGREAHLTGTGTLLAPGVSAVSPGDRDPGIPLISSEVRTLRAGTSPGSGCLTNCTAQQSGALERPFSLPRGSGTESLRATSRDSLHFPSEAGGLKGLHIPVD